MIVRIDQHVIFAVKANGSFAAAGRPKRFMY
jgi:hypothetical protein